MIAIEPHGALEEFSPERSGIAGAGDVGGCGAARNVTPVSPYTGPFPLTENVRPVVRVRAVPVTPPIRPSRSWSSWISVAAGPLRAIAHRGQRLLMPFLSGCAVGGIVVLLLTPDAPWTTERNAVPPPDLPSGAAPVILQLPATVTAQPAASSVQLSSVAAVRRSSHEASRRVPSPLRSASTPGPSLGTLSVESTPANARVSLNGERVGLTPLVLIDLRAGSRALRVDAPGYASWSAAIRVVANTTTKVNAVLSPKDGESVATVKTDP